MTSKTHSDFLPAVIRPAAAICLAALAIRLIGGIEIGPVGLLLLCCTLIASTVFGLLLGLIAAGCSVVAYHMATQSPLPPPDVRSHETLFLVLFGCLVVVVGLYTDVIRNQKRRADLLSETPQSTSAPPTIKSSQNPTGLDGRKNSGVKLISTAGRAQRALISVIVLCCGFYALLFSSKLVDAAQTIPVAMVCVVSIAALLGSQIGFVAGLLAAVLITALPHGAMQVNWPLRQVFDFFLFTASGWTVGLLRDERRQEQEALGILIEASGRLSIETDETVIRGILAEGLSGMIHGTCVEVFDESRSEASKPIIALGKPSPREVSASDKRWRTRRLVVNGSDAGFVRWRLPRTGLREAPSDRIITALTELAASAIIRSRLAAERAEMEYISRAEHLRSILLDAVSHHFRSPLAGITGSVTGILNLADDHHPSVRREFLLIIKEQANRLSRYVDNFLSLARLENESLEVNPSNVDLEELIYKVWDTFGELGSDRRYLDISIDPSPIYSDAALLAQIFGNILQNAIKFSPEGSVVQVRSSRDAHFIAVEIIDAGSGVQPASLERMFERFYRSPGAEAPGLGLGLYITRSLVKILGGSVGAQNRSDGEAGLIVSINLPTGTKAP